MKLNELFKGVQENSIPLPFSGYEIVGISCDSRQMNPKSLFVALPGTQCDGASFVPQAIERGALAVVVGEGFPDALIPQSIYAVKVKSPKDTLRRLLRNFYGNPSAMVKTIGVTGTNGKTTITYVCEAIIRAMSKRAGVLGTIHYRLGDKILNSTNTTPGIIENQRYLYELAQEKIDYCVMEVSSHALDQGRVDLIDFDAAIFSNLTGDHLDYHNTMEEYFRAKSRLFTRLPSESLAVINGDDAYGQRLMSQSRGRIVTYGTKNPCDFWAKDIHLNFTGSQFTIHHPKGTMTMKTPLIGLHNVYNILAACAVFLSRGGEPSLVRRGVESLNHVPGRLEAIKTNNGSYIFVDYAHTEDALKNVLLTLRAIRHSRIILVFGCGGNRDRTKRPKMGQVACELADMVIITTDNPRNEDPQTIAEEISLGCERKNFQILLDRTEAIQHALAIARKGDIILIAGKGHETYQIFRDRTIHFDDREVVKQFLQC